MKRGPVTRIVSLLLVLAMGAFTTEAASAAPTHHGMSCAGPVPGSVVQSQSASNHHGCCDTGAACRVMVGCAGMVGVTVAAGTVLPTVPATPFRVTHVQLVYTLAPPGPPTPPPNS